MLSFQSIPIPAVLSGAAAAYLLYRMYARRPRSGAGELRAEICKERESLRCMIEALPEQLESVKRSRIAAARATGYCAPEATRQWLNEMEVDFAEVQLLRSQLLGADTDSTDDSGMELEIKLAEILASSIRANRLADKYCRALSEDKSSEDISSEDDQDAETLFEQAASLPAQARVQHAAMSLIAPS
jgi:hypothetical protein